MKLVDFANLCTCNPYNPTYSLLNDVKRFDVENVEGYTGKYDSTLIVIVQASGEITEKPEENDWFRTNLRIGKVRDGFGNRIHKGYFQAWHNIKTTIVDKLGDLKSIIFTGFSLGGAIATLASYYMKKQFPNLEIGCVSFGAPRVGNIRFRSNFNHTIYSSQRVVFGRDIVTKLPPWLLGYFHVKTLIKIESQYRDLSDHNLGRYIENI